MRNVYDKMPIRRYREEVVFSKGEFPMESVKRLLNFITGSDGSKISEYQKEIKNLNAQYVLPILEKEKSALGFLPTQVKFADKKDGIKISDACVFPTFLPTKEKGVYNYTPEIIFSPKKYATLSEFMKLYYSFHELKHYAKTSWCVYNDKFYEKIGTVVSVCSQSKSGKLYVPKYEKRIGIGLTEAIEDNKTLEYVSLAFTGSKEASYKRSGGYTPLVDLWKPCSSANYFHQIVDKLPISHCLGLYLDMFEENPKHELARYYKSFLKAFDDVFDRLKENDFNDENLIIYEKEKQDIKAFNDFYAKLGGEGKMMFCSHELLEKFEGITQAGSIIENLEYKQKQMGLKK